MAEHETPLDATMTTSMLKAFANPLRRRIATEFNRRKFNRAADIAAALGEPANKISFHLRVLADAGLIAEAPEQARDGRDRVWTVVETGGLNVAQPGEPAADPVLANAVVRGLLEDHQRLVQRLVAQLPSYFAGETDVAKGTFSTNHVALTPEEFDAMMARIQQVIYEAKDAHVDGDDATQVYDIDIVAAGDPA